jgi:hypothetical protein
MSNKEIEVIKEGSALDKLRQAYPQHAEDSYVKTILPQIRFKAKAVLDEAGEKVLHKAGTFMIVTKEGEGETAEYVENPIGVKINVSVLYERYRLSYYDAGNNEYVSSPIFDNKDEIVKLFKGSKQYASGTVAELQNLPEFIIEEDGKSKKKLQLQKVLYVFYNDAVHEMTLSLGNGYNWRKFKQENIVPAITTEITSVKNDSKPGNVYNEMVFKNAGWLTEEEAERNLALVENIVKGIEAEKAYYGQSTTPENMTAVPTALPSGDDF